MSQYSSAITPRMKLLAVLICFLFLVVSVIGSCMTSGAGRYYAYLPTVAYDLKRDDTEEDKLPPEKGKKAAKTAKSSLARGQRFIP